MDEVRMVSGAISTGTPWTRGALKYADRMCGAT
jgi:hypothetical protein